MQNQLPARKNIKKLRDEILHLFSDYKPHTLQVLRPLASKYPKSTLLYGVGEVIRQKHIVKMQGDTGMRPMFILSTTPPKQNRIQYYMKNADGTYIPVYRKPK